MAQTLMQERRVLGLADRRMFRRGGRRAEHRLALDIGPIVACALCGVRAAAICSFEYDGGQPMTMYRCARCGHIDRRVDRSVIRDVSDTSVTAALDPHASAG